MSSRPSSQFGLAVALTAAAAAVATTKYHNHGSYPSIHRTRDNGEANQESLSLFTGRLHHDIRFEIYNWLVIQEAEEVRIHNILEPEQGSPYSLVSLRRTNSFLRQELTDWLAINKSWVACNHSRSQIYGKANKGRTYVLQFKETTFMSPKALLNWHRFCFRNPEPKRVKHLVIEVDLDKLHDRHDHSQVIRGMFRKAYNVEAAMDEYMSWYMPHPEMSFARSLRRVEIIYKGKERRDFLSMSPIEVEKDWNKLWCDMTNTTTVRSRLNVPSFFRDKARSLTLKAMTSNDKLLKSCLINRETPFSPRLYQTSSLYLPWLIRLEHPLAQSSHLLIFKDMLEECREALTGLFELPHDIPYGLILFSTG